MKNIDANACGLMFISDPNIRASPVKYGIFQKQPEQNSQLFFILFWFAQKNYTKFKVYKKFISIQF